MDKLQLVFRLLLGLALLVFGVDKFLHFMPQPAPPPEAARFLGALVDAGYVFPIIGVVFVVSGLLLLTGKGVGLALVLVAPIFVNIIMYHVCYDMAGIGAGAGLTAMALLLAFFHRTKFRELLR